MRYERIEPGKAPRPALAMPPEEKRSVDVRGLHAGVLLVHGAGWTASMPAARCYVEGKDLESAAAELRDLPPGVWVTNAKARELGGGSRDGGRKPRSRFRDHGFYRAAIEDLCAEWGVAIDSRPPAEALERLAWALQRVMLVVNEAGQMLLDAPPDAWQPAGEEWMHDRITEKPSLSTAILGLVCPGLPEDPEEQKLGHVMETAYVRGLTGRRTDPGEPVFRARIPGLRHAGRVLQAAVPAEGEWVSLTREEGDTDEAVEAEVRSVMEAGDKPVIVVRGDGGAGGAPGASGLVRLLAEKGSPRGYLVAEDFELAKEYFRPGGMMVGPGWRPSPFMPLLECLRSTSCSQAHEMKLVSGYWCVNMAAENMLCAATRRTKMLRQDSGPSLAACWYGARDRIEMMPYWRGLGDAGAEPLNGYAGRFRFTAPEDPEVMARIADAAWEMGLLLDAETLAAFQAAGAKMPERTQRSWRGEIGEGILASTLARGNIPAMADIDSIRGWSLADRGKAWRDIIVKNRGVQAMKERQAANDGKAA